MISLIHLSVFKQQIEIYLKDLEQIFYLLQWIQTYQWATQKRKLIINTIQIRMVQLVKKFFREFDMFSSFATFRTKGQQQTSNTCGGIASFLILLFFIYVFIFQFTQVANWENIQSIQTQNNTLDPSRQVKNLMVGVGLEGFRIQGIMEFLRFQIVEVTKNASKIISTRTLLTQKCTQSHWSELGNALSQNYQSFNLKNKLCLVPGQDFSVQQNSNGFHKSLTVQVNACRRKYPNGTIMYPNCADENTTQFRNDYYIQSNKYFIVNVVFMTTALNPLSKIPATKIMNQVRLTFTIGYGAEAYVYLSTYQIQTDQSIMPVQDIKTENGFALDKVYSNAFQTNPYFEHASCFFQLSTASLLITRSVGKIDEVLSYAGGLFGIIISFLSFFLLSFNKYRYEIMAASSAFGHNDKGKKLREEDFTFFLYLKYEIFDWIKICTCHELNWNDCKLVEETRQQVVNQLDISLMFKKIQYFQRFIEYIITDKQKLGLFLNQPPSIDIVKRKRMMTQYYEKIMQDSPCITIQDIFNIIKINSSIIVRMKSLQASVSMNKLSGQKDNSQNSSLNEESFYEREDLVQHCIAKYLQIEEKSVQDNFNQEPDFNEEELQIEKQIALVIFTIPKASRSKIIKKIPLKILNRLLKVKNQCISYLSSIELQI